MNKRDDKIKLLLVEDDEDFRTALTARLVKNGFQVTGAVSAEDALEKIDDADPDAVVADIKLPGMDGIEFLSKVRKINSDLPVILVTGYGSMESAKEALRLNATDYLLKPLEGIEELLNPIHKAVHTYRLSRKNERLTADLRIKIKELEKSERKYKDLFESASDSICTVDIGGMITAVNRKMEEVTKYGREELIGKPVAELISFVNKQWQQEKIGDVISGRAVEMEEVRIITRDGQVRLGEMGMSAIHTDGKINGIQCMVRDITERKQAESELMTSEHKYRTLVESIPQKIFIKDRNSVYVSCNGKYAADLNIRSEEIAGKTDYDFYPRDLAEKYRADDRDIIESGRTGDIEERYIEKGQDRIVHTVKTPVRDREGNIVGVLGIFWDITGIKRTEEAMRISERKFKDLTETTTDWIWEVDKEGVYTYVSPKVKDLLGYEVDEVLGKTPFDLMPEAEAERVGKAFKEKVDKKESFYKLENINRHKDGHPVVLETNGIPIFDEKGQLKGYRGIDRDVTGRKETEKVINDLARFPSEDPQPVLRVDRDGVILYANDAALSLFGDLGIGVGRRVPEECYGLVREAFESQRNVSIDHKCGDRTFLFDAVPVMDEGYANLYGRDITDLKKAEEGLEESQNVLKKQAKKMNHALKKALKSRKDMEKMLAENNLIRETLEKNLEKLKKTQNMLVQSEKLVSIGRLVSEMAHEVNNPLQVIAGRVELCIMKGLQNTAMVEDNLRIIEKQCWRAKDVIERLLTFSKPGKGEVKLVNMKESLETVISLVEHQYMINDIKIVREYSSEPIMVEVDEKHMEEVYMNLLKNAAEAMPGGGAITVSTSRKDDTVRVDFSDTGCGMSEDIMKNILDPFFTTKEQGTGLGLSVCHGIVQAQGGELRYKSEPGKGTTATIVLRGQGKEER